MIADAMQRVGAARSIVIDEDGVVLAGNATVEAAAQAGIEKLRVVDATGDELIAVRRTGLTPEQKADLKVSDNRTAELATWDPPNLSAYIDDGLIDPSLYFYEPELDKVLADLAADVPPFDPAAEWQGMPEFHQDDQTAEFKCIVNFATVEDMERFEELVGQRIPRNTKSIWYPPQERSRARELEYVTDAA